MNKSIALATCILIFGSALVANSTQAQSTGQGTVAPYVAELKRSLALEYRRADQLQKQIDSMAEVKKTVQAKMGELWPKDGSSAVSSESFSEITKNLQARRIDLIIDLAGLEARRDAIQVAKESSQQGNQQAIKTPLEQIIDLQESELEKLSRIEHLSTKQLEQQLSAKKALLDAKVRLAQITANENAQVGSNLLNDTLLTTSLELAEKNAQLSTTERLLKQEVAPSREKLRLQDELETQLDALTDRENTVAKLLDETKRKFEELKLELEDAQGENDQ